MIKNDKDFKQLKLDLKAGNYRYIGSGSGRRVFDMGNGYVVKLAKNSKGVAQNKTENNIWEDTKSNLLARILKVSDDFELLFMAKAEKIENMASVREYFHVNNNRELFQTEELKDIIRKYNLMSVDLYRTTNWGIVNDKPVIIDYGYTREVKRKYYGMF